MQNTVALIFGIFVLLTAFGLAGWEIISRRKDYEEFRWLHTHSRFRRRITMAILLVFVAVLMLGEAAGVLALDNVRHLMMYVGSLAVLALALVVLSVRDLGEMAQNAERHAIQDLKKALDEQENQDPPQGS